jgi:hypothetical protein
MLEGAEEEWTFMDNAELVLSEEELSAIVQKIVETRTTDEPFSSQEDFWKQGFHKRAFSWLPQDIKFALFSRYEKQGADLCSEFQRRLNEDIKKIAVLFVSTPDQLEAFAKSGRWCDYRHLRKAVLTRLYKHSFSLLGPPINDENHSAVKFEYREWLPGEWIRSFKK